VLDHGLDQSVVKFRLPLGAPSLGVVGDGLRDGALSVSVELNAVLVPRARVLGDYLRSGLLFH
jgi:hypothetical protein